MSTRILTDNQLNILRLVMKGWSNQEIADDLGRSKRTVDHTLNKIYRVLRVKNRIQALSKAESLGLFDEHTP